MEIDRDTFLAVQVLSLSYHKELVISNRVITRQSAALKKYKAKCKEQAAEMRTLAIRATAAEALVALHGN